MIQLYQTLDLRPIGIPQTLRLSQYDSDFEIIFELTNFDGAWILDTDTTAEVQGTKTDGHGYSADAVFDDQLKTVTIAGDVQMTAAAGRNVYEVVLFHDGDRLGSKNFILDVERAALDAETTQSDSQIKNFTDMVEAAEDAAETATAAAEAAEEAATGIPAIKSEVENVRIGADGVTYASAGDAVRGQFTELKEDLNAFAGYKVVISQAADWEQGTFTSAGVETPATNRIRTKEQGLHKSIQDVTAINGYKFLAYGWDDNEYLGVWNGSDFTTGSLSGLTRTELDLRPLYSKGAVYIRLILMKPTSSDPISPSDGVNVKFGVYANDIYSIRDNIAEINGFVTDVKAYVQKGNIYSVKTDALTGRYYYRNNGRLSNGANANFNGFIVPVLKNRVYTFTKSNILLLDNNKQLLNTSGGNYDFAGTSTCYSGNASYFAVSYKTSDVPSEGYAISMGDSVDYSEYALGIYTIPVPEKKILERRTVTGEIADGGNLPINGESGVRDGEMIVFKGSFSSFGQLEIKFVGTNVTNSIAITRTNLVVNNGVTASVTEAHGLTIANDISVLLEIKTSKLYVSVSSSGVIYKYNCLWDWTGSRMSYCSAYATGMSFTNAVFSAVYSSAKRSIWYFGDSYAAFNTDARLPYYMVEYGYDKNVMFNSVSGSSTAGAVIAITTLLAYGNPEYLICATGMNDGSDSDSTPNTNWLTNIQKIIDICENHGITPVLCTVPTIPSVNNNAKNAWVKASGYRYIDMASAVGADGTGTWYTGMLGQDNIHPSALGAVAQFMQLLADMPEVAW